jgi:hypothetical protein
MGQHTKAYILTRPGQRPVFCSPPLALTFRNMKAYVTVGF